MQIFDSAIPKTKQCITSTRPTKLVVKTTKEAIPKTSPAHSHQASPLPPPLRLHLPRHLWTSQIAQHSACHCIFALLCLGTSTVKVTCGPCEADATVASDDSGLPLTPTSRVFKRASVKPWRARWPSSAILWKVPPLVIVAPHFAAGHGTVRSIGTEQERRRA